MNKVEAKGVYKVFGSRKKEGLALALQGVEKEEVLRRTGCTVALQDVTLSIPAGQIFVIMGQSGSGKSTLVRHFNGLIQASAGEILIDGQDVTKLNARGLRELRRHKVSMVFQSFGLMPHKTALGNVAFPLIIRGEKRGVALEVGQAWLQRVGLEGYEQKYSDELSGGMQQRVGLARALATNTDVLLMDEPFSALDPLIRTEMQDQLLQLQKDLHKTIIFITHDLDEALRIGSQIAILYNGQLVQVGTPNQILIQPANDYVRRFVEKRASNLEIAGSKR
jgi:glycine betaine/proline transport system ATP-binding protein